MDFPITGRIIRVGPNRHFAFVRPTGGGENAFIPCGLVGNLEAGDMIRYTTIEGSRGPRVQWLETVA